MNKLEKAYAEALTKTLHAYEDLMADFAGNIDKWADYGRVATCRVCRVSEANRESTRVKLCQGCPMDSPDGLVCGRLSSEHAGSTVAMCKALATGDELLAMPVIKTRYKSIIETIKHNGWEYK